MRRLVGGLLLAATFAAQVAAAGEPTPTELEAARRLYAQAMDDERKGDWTAALAKLERVGTVRMTARGFLNVFGAPTDTDIDVPRRGAKVSVPAAIFHGTADDISLPANAQAIHDSFVAAPSRELVWVEGGKHSLEPGPVAEKYAQAVGAWLARVLPATA